jgi:hypothetical protein
LISNLAQARDFSNLNFEIILLRGIPLILNGKGGGFDDWNRGRVARADRANVIANREEICKHSGCVKRAAILHSGV